MRLWVSSVVITVHADTYKLKELNKYEGKIIAKNCKARFEQKGASLIQWRENMAKQYGAAQAQRMVS